MADETMCIYRGAASGKDIIIKVFDRTAYLFVNDKLYTRDIDKFVKGMKIYNSRSELRSDILRLSNSIRQSADVLFKTKE